MGSRSSKFLVGPKDQFFKQSRGHFLVQGSKLLGLQRVKNFGGLEGQFSLKSMSSKFFVDPKDHFFGVQRDKIFRDPRVTFFLASEGVNFLGSRSSKLLVSPNDQFFVEVQGAKIFKDPEGKIP